MVQYIYKYLYLFNVNCQSQCHVKRTIKSYYEKRFCSIDELLL